jgi:hypothetical protein
VNTKTTGAFDMKNLAARYHEGQFRKGPEGLPYIVHPQAVAEKLISWGEDPGSPAVSAAWGHDLLEDTTVTEKEIIGTAGEYVLECIKKLTCPEDMGKFPYLKSVAACGNRDVLLVKIADRICNTSDFISLKGKFYAWHYLHSADCLLPALQEFAGDPAVEKALKAWEKLDRSLSKSARREAILGCMAGGAVGDALGAPVEFLDRESIFRK